MLCVSPSLGWQQLEPSGCDMETGKVDLPFDTAQLLPFLQALKRSYSNIREIKISH